jgi:redox-sensitive bicupin YhaK (pirin superfamily)
MPPARPTKDSLMTIQLRRDKEIYATDGGWFQARWHFTFDRYHDPGQMGVGALRVFNDDRLQPGAVWPMHPHSDIESCTYVVEGVFAHEDSLGNDGRLEPGAAQVMRFSSRGALHSERNGSPTEPMRFLQFWILPSDPALESSVQQRQYTTKDRTGRLLQIMGPAGEDGLDLAQDARVLVARLPQGSRVTHDLGQGRGGYLYVLDGELEAAGDRLGGGDAAKLAGPEALELAGVNEAELILIDVPLRFQPVGVWAQRSR